MQDTIFNQGGYYSYYFKRNKNGINNFSTKTHYQFMYLKSGEFYAHFSKGVFKISGGELLYFPVNWQWDFEFGDCKEIEGVLFHFRNWPEVDEIDYVPQVIKTDENLKYYISQLPIGKTTIDSQYIWKMYRFLDEIQPYMQKNTNKHTKAIQRVVDFMRDNDDYTIPQLVQLSGLKKSCFYNAFEELMGMTPVEGKHRFQAYKAEFMLANSELTVDEIAKKLGFNSTPHFRKVVHSRYGVSPKEVRKRMVKENKRSDSV